MTSFIRKVFILPVIALTIAFAGPLPSASVAATPVDTPDSELTNAELSLQQPENPTAVSEADMRESSFTAAEKYGAETFPEIFGGLAYTHEESAITIFSTLQDSTFETEMRSRLKDTGMPVSIERTANSLSELNATIDRIKALAPKLREEGVLIHSFGPDVLLGRVLVDVVDLSPEVEARLASQFGAAALFQSIAADQSPTDIDRHTDSAPWNGGDFITNGTSDCTSGIPVHQSSGAYYLVTAAHCFPTGAVIRNRSATIPLGSNTTIGTVVARNTVQYSMDTELISTSSSRLVWVGGTATQNPVRYQFQGAASSPTGAQVCSSGAFEGSHCFAIGGSGYTSYSNTMQRYTSNLVRANGTNLQAIGGGDSGGAVYRPISGTSVYAAGTVSQIYGSTVTCANWYPQTSRPCGQSMYYSDIIQILQNWTLIVN